MTGRLTFAMIKPDAVESGKSGAILAHVQEQGFQVRAMRMVRLTRPEAEAFYAVHRERPFYGELVDFMISGPGGRHGPRGCWRRPCLADRDRGNRSR